ncbi:MAG: hypothetical protein NPIRA05_01070 [Nitrospirales bacterium]|nr:MAG: hypothetical protein NPIRA05_01070 [Nitrospirales bacterium]
MPIEIKELVIRASIDSKGGEGQGSPGKGQHSNEEMISECVEQVLTIIERQRER